MGRLVIFIGVLVAAVYLSQRLLIGQINDNEMVSVQSDTGKAGNLNPQATSSKQFSQQSQAGQTNTTRPLMKKLYKWKDAQGNLKFGEVPPDDVEYSEISYRGDSSTQSRPQVALPKSQFQVSSQGKPSRGESYQAAKQAIKAVDLPVQCRSKLRTLSGFERKLDKSKQVVASIWLESYCTALSELIQDGCVMPKEDVKYNRYCPVRYK